MDEQPVSIELDYVDRDFTNVLAMSRRDSLHEFVRRTLELGLMDRL